MSAYLQSVGFSIQLLYTLTNIATWQVNPMEQIQTLYGGQDDQSAALLSRICADYGDLEDLLRFILNHIGTLEAEAE